MRDGSSDSDFAEDPDEMEVPGGGKDLRSLEVSSILKKPERPPPSLVQMPSRQQMQLPVNILKQSIASGSMPIVDFNMLLKSREGHEFKTQDGLKLLLPNMFQLQSRKMDKAMAGSQQPGAFLAMSEESHEEEGMGVAETYANYMPKKVHSGIKHPDPVVESTSLAGVEPADIHYKVMFPETTIASGALSALQLESIHYACQQHERTLDDGSTAGFLIGDGAGVGKGRTIAGIIFENYLRKRKRSIWISVIGDLKFDCERDLKDIGASNIKVHSLNKMKYLKISSEENGGVKKGVIFCTYSSLIAKTNQAGGGLLTRFQQLLEWCTPEFDGVIVFDECHRAKNLAPAGNSKPTKTGMAVLDIQLRLPKAKIVYASATGATEPRNMAYMIRLGLWGKGTVFKDFPQFLSAMEIRGVGAMEILAMEMKQRGMYIARQLSFHGVSFKVVEVPLTDKFIKVYDKSTKLWAETLEAFKEVSVLLSTDKTVLWSLFWSAHQRFFKCLCIAAKVREAISISREAIKCGKCVVIGLQSTGEARLLEQIQKDEGILNDFVSSAKGILETLVEKHFPTDMNIDLDKVDTSSLGESNYERENRKTSIPKLVSKRRKIMDNLDDFSESEGEPEYYDEGNVIMLKTSDNRKSSDSPVYTGKFDADKIIENRFKAAAIKKNLLLKVKKLGKKLPPNALDELIDELGGTGNVAEMTGRKGRVVHSDEGFHYESRTESDVPLDLLNIAEKQRFMNGEKDVAIISEVASAGISLHSDRRAMNRKRRVHITLELPWSADRAIQQFGRTHRSNQASAPEYVFLISELAGERRFASVVAKRLESLGALTHGDRRATESRDLSRFNIDNKYGHTAMELTLKTLVGQEAPRVPFPTNYPNNFVSDACRGLESVGLLTKLEDGTFSVVNEKRSLGRFLNRILGLTVSLQNYLFFYFTATMDALIAEAKKLGNYDVGILDLAGTESNVERVGSEKFKWNNGNGEGIVELHKVLVERGMAWVQALSIWQGPEEGLAEFWLSQDVRGGRREVLLAERVKTATKPKCPLGSLYIVYRPNIGEQVKRETLGYLESKYRKVEKEQAEGPWKEHYEGSAETCSHMYWDGRCSVRSVGEVCDHGRRQRLYHVISGSVLGLWPTVQAVIQNRYISSSRLQVVRVSTSDGAKIVGTLIPNPCVAALRNTLADVTKPRMEHQKHQTHRA